MTFYFGVSAERKNEGGNFMQMKAKYDKRKSGFREKEIVDVKATSKWSEVSGRCGLLDFAIGFFI